LQSLGLDQRHIAIQHQGDASVIQQWQRLRHRMTRAQLLGLFDPQYARFAGKAVLTASPPCPYTTTRTAASRRLAALKHMSQQGPPPSGCKTLGKSETIRLPWPAARITTESCCMGRLC
jgi:hypothetical protein